MELLKDLELAVYRSLQNIFVQVIDDTTGNTLVLHQLLKKVQKLKKGSNIEAAKQIGERIAKKALDKGITAVVFDRGGYVYTGRVKAVADDCKRSRIKILERRRIYFGQR